MLPDSFYLAIAVGCVLAGALLDILRARARRARSHCLCCGTPRGWWRRATARDPRCHICRLQAGYAARAGLWPVYQAALWDAWERCEAAPALWRRVGNALFYAGVAARFAPARGEEAAVRDAAALGAALGKVRERHDHALGTKG